MAYALQIAKEQGIEALEEQIKRRGISFAPCRIPQKELDEFSMRVKENAVGTITVLAAYVLRNKFDWGNRGRDGKRGRLDEFRYWMNYYADSVLQDYFTIGDAVEDLATDAKVDLFFEMKNINVRI